MFDAGNGAHLRTLALDAGNVVRLLWTRNGRDLAACPGWGQRHPHPAGRRRPVFADNFAQPCFGLAELPDGSLLASGFDGKIRQYRPDGATWSRVRQIDTEISDPQSLAVSPDGRHFAVGYRSRLPDRQVAVDVFDTAGHSGAALRVFRICAAAAWAVWPGRAMGAPSQPVGGRPMPTAITCG